MALTDMRALRGKLLSIKKYNSSNAIVAKTMLDYSNVMYPAKAVRSVYSMFKNWYSYVNVSGANARLNEVRSSAYYIHTSPVLLVQKTESQYDNAGAEMKVEMAYTYDDFNNLTEERITSTDAASDKVTNYKYAYHAAVSETVAGTKQKMIDAFMIGIPLEATTNFGEGAKAEFKDFNGKILPYIFYKQVKTGAFIEKSRILAYGSFNLPTEIQAIGYPKEVYTWDNGLIVSKMTGLPNTTTALTWGFSYKTSSQSRLLDVVTDENGLRTKFTYDGYQRLIQMQNRFTGVASNPQEVQATTEYAYQFTDANNPYSFITTINRFKSVAASLVTKQYVDGLGRPVGTVKEGYTPNGLHLKTSVSYDALGRQEKAFLPFESGGLGYQQVLGGIPFVKTEYEASSLSRPVKQINVDNSTILTAYGTNHSTEVRMFVSNNGSVLSTRDYAPNTLYKTTMTDENGNPTIAFKDKLGRVILTRKFCTNALTGLKDTVETYNVYDVYGQLVAVIPPGAQTNGVVNVDLTFQYQYDVKGRLMEKMIPGSEAQKFYYDARDLVVLTQDGNMRAAQKHLATQYDALGRVVKTGLVTVSPTSGPDYTAAIAITDAERLTEIEYYPNKLWVKHQGARVLKPTGTSTPTDFVWSYVERRDALNYTGNPVWTGKQHLMYDGVAQRKINENTDWHGVDWSVTGVNGAQQPTLSIRYLNGGGAGVSDVRTWQEFAYDHGMRMTDQKYRYALNGDGWSDPSATLANMVYNYKDQLIEKNIGYRGANNSLQSIDYYYNVRGGLTAINDVGLSSA